MADPSGTGDMHVASPSVVARTIATSYGSLVVALTLGFLVTPVLLDGLGTEGYGVWSLLGAVASLLGLIEIGVGAASVRRVAAARATRDDDRIGRVLSSNLWLNVIFAGLAVVVVLTLVVILDRIFELSDEQIGPARLVLTALGFAQVVTFLSTGYIALLVGSGRAPLLSILGTLTNLVTGCGLMLVILLGFGLVSLALVTFTAAVVNAFVLRLVARRTFPAVRPRRRQSDRTVVKELVRAGSLNALIAAGAILATGSDLILLGLFTDAESVAAYAVAVRGVSMVKTLATRATDVLQPSYAYGQALSDTARLSRMHTESVFSSYLVAGPLAVVLVLQGRPLLEMWLGDPPPSSYTILVLLLIALLVQLPGHASFTLLTGVERLRFLALTVLTAGIANCAISSVLTIRYGVIGPALGTLACVSVAEALVLPWYVHRMLGSSASRFALETVGRHLPPLVASSCVVLALSAAWTGDIAVLTTSGVGILVYLAALWLTAGGERRTTYRHLVRSLARAKKSVES